MWSIHNNCCYPDNLNTLLICTKIISPFNFEIKRYNCTMFKAIGSYYIVDQNLVTVTTNEHNYFIFILTSFFW